MAKNLSLGTMWPSMLRRSNIRVVEFGLLGLKVLGISVKGTSEASCASSGDQLVDIASSPTVPRLICNASLRLISAAIFPLLAPAWARKLWIETMISPKPLRHLPHLCAQADVRLAAEQ